MKKNCIFCVLFSFVSLFGFGQLNKYDRKYKMAAEYRAKQAALRINKTNSVQSTTYSVSSIAYTPYSFTGSTVLNGNDDMWTTAIPIGFNFCYYGISYNKIVVGANGNITFDTTQSGGYNNWNITTAMPNAVDFPSNTICVAYRDIDCSLGGQIVYQLVGSAPNRALVVSWVNIPLFDNGSGTCDGTPNSTFQLVLYETTNNIDIYIQNSYSCSQWNGGYGEVGLEDQTGTVAVCPPNRNYPNTWSAVNEAWHFAPTNNSCVYPPPPPCNGISTSSICFVTTDDSLKNEIYFNHNTSLTAGCGTVIYRLNALSLWDSIGYVASTQPDKFIDLTANPNQQSYSYCVAASDSLHHVCAKSLPHTTIFLQSSLGTGSQVNLSWSAYGGFTPASYYIYRGSSAFTMSLINQVSSSTFAYTDLNPPTGTNFYQVSIHAPVGCTSNAPFDTLIGSNYKSSALTSINNLNNVELFNVYPNPSNGQISITSSVNMNDITVTNVVGQIVFEDKNKSQKINLQIENAGLYFIAVTIGTQKITRKVVINK